jgi:glycosyltransferase involved in cell wall biosynthesis
VFWVPLAFLWGARVLLTRKVDVIYSSSPPHSCHLATFLLAKCFRKPYVIDFRDPWFVGPTPSPRGAVRRAMESLQPRLKRAVVTGAGKVIAVSRGERDELKAEFPEIEGGRFAYITNGYDADDFANVPPVARDPSKFVLTHAGTIYAGVANEFFESLELLLRGRPNVKEVLRINLIGANYTASNCQIAHLIRTGTIVNHGFQPHARALQYAAASDVLVILAGGDVYLPSHLPAKVFEYMRLGRPILAVTREGELSRLLHASGLGVVVPPKEPLGLAAAIWHLYARARAKELRLKPNWNVIETFERRVLTASLASALDEARSTTAEVQARAR